MMHSVGVWLSVKPAKEGLGANNTANATAPAIIHDRARTDSFRAPGRNRENLRVMHRLQNRTDQWK